MREFVCTVKIRLRQGEPTVAAFKHLGMQLIGYSKLEPQPEPVPAPQVIKVGGVDAQEFGKF